MCKVKSGVQGKGTRGMLQNTGGWKTQTLPPQLGKTDSGPMGPSSSSRGPDRIVRNTPTIQAPTQQVWAEPDQTLFLDEIKTMIEKGAIRELTRAETPNGFFSSMFLVPKKDGKMRPVINLKRLNDFVETHHFKLEGLQTARELIRPNNWLTKIDLKDAYFTIPICESHRKYLRFRAGRRAFQFTCLPFGLSSAPWIFTKTLRPVAAKLRELGVRLVTYLDDNFVIANTPEQAADHTSALIYTLENLGFVIHDHPEKSMTQPTQRVEFLGMIIDSSSMELQVPGQKKLSLYGRKQGRFYTRGQPRREKCPDSSGK